ncbi:FeoC-like transcriptional regulator [Haloplanus salilacus]|uniref:FeoC-like transcriptional regulator n=1 Tax=Haloplanus salilacus TaxID=2949994 RepID=UPI0030D3F87D
MGDATERDLTADGLYDEMEVLEPYTTGELASTMEASRAQVRDLLERLATSARVRKKTTDSERAIWLRTPSTHECGNCGYTYEVTFLHPVLSAVRFCPRCGTRVES